MVKTTKKAHTFYHNIFGFITNNIKVPTYYALKSHYKGRSGNTVHNSIPNKYLYAHNPN